MSKDIEKEKRERRKKYDVSTHVRCNKTELENLHNRAAESNLSLSRFLVECSLAAENQPDPKERELREKALFELRRAGANLNRIAKRNNQNSGAVSNTQIEKVMKEISHSVLLFEKRTEGKMIQVNLLFLQAEIMRRLKSECSKTYNRP